MLLNKLKTTPFAQVLILITMLLLGAEKAQAQAVPVEQPAETAPAGGFGLAVGPTIVRLVGLPGETKTSTGRIWNHGSEPIEGLTEITDVSNETDENKVLNRRFPPPGTTPYSCAPWIYLSEENFVIESKQYRDVDITLTAEAESAGGYAAVVFFRGIPSVVADETDPKKATTTVVIQPRLGVLVFFESEGTVKRTGELVDFNFQGPQKDGDPIIIGYEFKNTGNTDILLTGSFFILDGQKALVGKGELKSIRTFPMDQGIAVTEWAGFLEPGQYEIFLNIEIGPDAEEVIVKDFPFTVE